MERSTGRDLVPENIKGKKTDIFSEITFSSHEQAAAHFRMARERLFKVEEWNALAGSATADFELIDEAGNKVSRPVQKGDFFKIDIPGPGSGTGEGHDWVQVELIEEKDDAEGEFEYSLIKVRPASNPANSKPDTAHFFKEDANSFFVVRRDENSVRAEVHGRNEVPNTDAEDIADKIRNTVVAIGAIFGFSNIQWKSLTNGIVKE